MAGLPSVQKQKMETLKAGSNTELPIVTHVKPPTPTAVISMNPLGETKPTGEAPKVDENQFATTPSTTTTPTTITTTTSEPPTEVDWKTEAAELKQKWKSVSGMYERSKTDVQELRDKMTSMETALEEARKAKPVYTPEPDEELTPEQEEAYKEAFPVIRSLGKKAAREVIEQLVNPLKDEIAALKTQTTNVTKDASTISERVFYNGVRDKVKTMDDIIADPKWQDYLGRRVPFTTGTIGQALVAAHNARDMETVVEIFSGFNQPSDGSNGLASMASPTFNSSGQPASQPIQKPILKWSGRQKASEDFRKGRIPQAQFNEISEIYKAAERENRIDYKA